MVVDTAVPEESRGGGWKLVCVYPKSESKIIGRMVACRGDQSHTTMQTTLVPFGASAGPSSGSTSGQDTNPAAGAHEQDGGRFKSLRVEEWEGVLSELKRLASENEALKARLTELESDRRRNGKRQKPGE